MKFFSTKRCIGAGLLGLCFALTVIELTVAQDGEKKADAGGVSIKAAPGKDETLDDIQLDILNVLTRTRAAMLYIGGGSGVCISPDGYALTNDHVLESARYAYDAAGRETGCAVIFGVSGKSYHAKAIGSDPRGDLVLLKLALADGEEVPFTPLGDSDALTVGDPLLSVGDPGSLSAHNRQPTVTFGEVAALSCFAAGYAGSIRLSAAQCPGSSGGPTFNIRGEVVGINGRGVKARESYGLVNYAEAYTIPSNQARRFVAWMKERPGGATIARHGLVGGLAVKHELRRKGVQVLAVREGSTAELAGFRPGDVITRIDDKPVGGVLSYYSALHIPLAGMTATFLVSRQGGETTIHATLDVPVNLDQTTTFPRVADPIEDAFIFQDKPESVFNQVYDLTRATSAIPKVSMQCVIERFIAAKAEGAFSRMPIEEGLIVKALTDPSSPDDPSPRDKVEANPLQVGDVITHVGERRIRFAAELDDCLCGRKAGDSAQLRVLRDGAPLTLSVALVAAKKETPPAQRKK